MPESKKLRTITLISYNSVTNEISITAQYVGEDDYGDVIFVDIAEDNINVEGLQIQQGNLYAYVKNYPDYINMVIDDNGHLIIFSAKGDEDRYSIDSDTGRLLYQID